MENREECCVSFSGTTTITVAVHVKLNACWVQVQPPKNAQGDYGSITD